VLLSYGGVPRRSRWYSGVSLQHTGEVGHRL
jgi:hypothetical protein